jgi:hypothetical protein
MRWILLTPALLLLLAGCLRDGGGKGPPTRSEYVKQANEICRTWGARRDALGRVPEGGTARYAQYVRDAQTIAREERARLNRLRPPHSLQPLLKKWRRENQTLAREGKSVRRATAQLRADGRAKRYSGPAVEEHSTALQQAERALLSTIQRIRGLFRRMGLTECAR